MQARCVGQSTFDAHPISVRRQTRDTAQHTDARHGQPGCAISGSGGVVRRIGVGVWGRFENMASYIFRFFQFVHPRSKYIIYRHTDICSIVSSIPATL